MLVCTRTSEHADLAVEVLRAGKHLLLEKPGAISLPDQSGSGRPRRGTRAGRARVAYMRRHDAAFCELARLIASGAIGEPFAVKLASREDFPPSEDDLAAGGFIMDVGVHDFDTARWLLGQGSGHGSRSPTARSIATPTSTTPTSRSRLAAPWQRRISRGRRGSAWRSAARWSAPTARPCSHRPR